MKTALQQLKEALEKEWMSNRRVNEYNQGVQFAIDILQSLFPAEQNQIEQAYDTGAASNLFDRSGTDYFTTTYNTTQ